MSFDPKLEENKASTRPPSETALLPKQFSCDFEVFGKVQGVLFRKCAEKQAKSLGLRGWCQNTLGGSVKGELEGTTNQIVAMQYWLEHTGSPESQILKVNFSKLKQLEKPVHQKFKIRT